MSDRPARTLLEQRIRELCLTYEEFVQHAETFARDHREPGTLSLRHLQRLASGHHLGPLRPATVRLLEHLFGEPIAALLAAPNTPTASEAEDRTAELYCELLRLLSMVGVLVTMPTADEQRGQFDYPAIPSGRFDNVAVDGCAALNEHLWRVFVLSMSKGAVLPLVRDQLGALISRLNRSEGISTHRQLCSLASELSQLAGEVYFDANRYGDAAYCYTLAAVAGKEADAFDLWACAMTRHAFIEIYGRRPGKAVPMLELAARLARRGDGALSTRYWVSSVQAQAFAGLGELAACQRALDAAEQVRELSDDASNGGWLRFDGSRLAEERGACYVQLRRPELAEDALRGALRQDLSARRRASVLTDLATVGLQRNDMNQLICHAEAALEIATQTRSARLDRVRSVASCTSFRVISRRYLETVGFDNSISESWPYPEIFNFDDWVVCEGDKLSARQGRAFREAWISGVLRHYPGEPKPSYVTPWDETPDWERESATAVYDQVRAFIDATDGATAKLTRSQKGRFVALCWIGQIFKHFPDPKPAYVADWDDLPSWQQETDADIFERIEQDT